MKSELSEPAAIIQESSIPLTEAHSPTSLTIFDIILLLTVVFKYGRTNELGTFGASRDYSRVVDTANGSTFALAGGGGASAAATRKKRIEARSALLKEHARSKCSFCLILCVCFFGCIRL
jgi:hypothetical protein